MRKRRASCLPHFFALLAAAAFACGGRSSLLQGADGDDGGPSSDQTGMDGSSPKGRAKDWGSVTPGTWITVQPGTFFMGSPASEPCRDSYDEDRHQVVLSRRFEISSTEVTQGQFASLMGENPSTFSSCGSSCPVENITWHLAAAYCNALSALGGLGTCYSCTGSGAGLLCSTVAAFSGSKLYDCPGYRLPLEAEWEYAYRAGTTTAFYNGGIVSCEGNDATAEPIAWYSKSSGGSTHPAAHKQPNAWGLFDMAGNVGEWCQDFYTPHLASSTPAVDPWGPASGTNRVLRFGSWGSGPRTVRAASRSSFPPTDHMKMFGFRCVRTIAGP